MKHLYAAALICAAVAAPAAAQEIKIGYALAEDSHYGVAAKAFEESLKAVWATSSRSAISRHRVWAANGKWSKAFSLAPSR